MYTYLYRSAIDLHRSTPLCTSTTCIQTVKTDLDLVLDELVSRFYQLISD